MSASGAAKGPRGILGPARFKGIGIHSHLVILCILLAVFVLMSALSFWYESRYEDELEFSFQQSLSLLTKPPELRPGIRQMDLMAKVQADALRVQRISRRLYLIRLILDLMISAFVTFYLLYFILRPLRAVEDIAIGWKLGEPWPVQTLSSMPEVHNLIDHFAQMAGRLNNEFGKAEELSEFKTKLVSVVSHEFGNALAVIKSATFLLEEKLPPESLEKNRRLFRMIASNISELSGAVQNLLNMGRMEAGKFAINFVATDAVAILRNTFKRVELLCEEKDLQVSLEFPEGLEPVKADPAALTLVISNLVSNAIKYTPKNGRIVLGILRESSRPGYYRIYVQDSGIGISVEERDKILSGHYRTEGGRKMTLKGYGVGLSLSEQIIQAHDSTIDIEGSPGKGSRFSFLLPAAG